MADSDFFLGEYSVISEVWSSLQISELIRSPISYALCYFVTVDQEITAFDTTLNLSADLLFLEITCTYNSLFIRKMFVANIHEFKFSLMRFDVISTSGDPCQQGSLNQVIRCHV